MLDHLLRRSLTLDKLKFLIFDEADRMLSMGFYPDMRRVQAYLPEKPISSYMFSATFPPQVIRLAAQFLQTPGFLNLSSDHIHVTETEHVYYTVPGMDKDRSLVRIIEVENPPSALIFCNTKVRVDYVATVLQRFGYDADMLTSDLSQAAREKVMERVRQRHAALPGGDGCGGARHRPARAFARDPVRAARRSRSLHPPRRAHRAGGRQRHGDHAGQRGRTLRAAAHWQALQHRPAGATAAQRRGRGAGGLRADHHPAGGAPAQPRPAADGAHAALSPLARSLEEGEEEAGLLAMLLDDFYQETFHAPLITQGEGQAEASPVGKSMREGRRRSGRSRGKPH